jgi:hypothetical protein
MTESFLAQSHSWPFPLYAIAHFPSYAHFIDAPFHASEASIWIAKHKEFLIRSSIFENFAICQSPSSA